MRVEELKEILNNALEVLEQYEDNDKVKMVSNTYFLGYPRHYLGIAGSEGGYIALDYLEENIKREDDEDE